MTQPAIFLHSVILAKTLGDQFQPDMTAGHSLGDCSALVAAGALSFDDGLVLVYAICTPEHESAAIEAKEECPVAVIMIEE